jgi:hypothetical protein
MQCWVNGIIVTSLYAPNGNPQPASHREEVHMSSMKKEEARQAVLGEYEKAPQQSQHDGRLSVLPILTERKVGPSRFPCGWRLKSFTAGQ